ncbi:DUF7010 family protein [Lentiprolixibacter aurantiacus]|uniref:Uncharacterized protein n=1 Tax=Lentiprolixibacter aurantiacus TaxID=2993939 RepID=A0AAE3MIZ6_9FLAO|nr:hypothetical protein [Lentiprolixibacter aurantiacus]MCX2718103.1 hypothetical protein [Lentiprolixibacter aurantiacus]
MVEQAFQKLKQEIQLQAKNGIEFILAAGILWLFISYLWTLEYSAYNKSIFTFIVGAFLLPLAFGLSKALKTNWKIKDNPLQPLGLWLNFAQLIYFPFLIFILIKYPDYFIMTYAIITGAHLFPYTWFYDEMGYAAAAILISVGSMLIALNSGPESMWHVPLFTAILLFLLAFWIYVRWKNKNLKS